MKLEEEFLKTRAGQNLEYWTGQARTDIDLPLVGFTEDKFHDLLEELGRLVDMKFEEFKKELLEEISNQ